MSLVVNDFDELDIDMFVICIFFFSVFEFWIFIVKLFIIGGVWFNVIFCENFDYCFVLFFVIVVI